MKIREYKNKKINRKEEEIMEIEEEFLIPKYQLEYQ